jgi:phosphoribosylformylglycinamidine (FGAM) synthase PurS component
MIEAKIRVLLEIGEVKQIRLKKMFEISVDIHSALVAEKGYDKVVEA